MKSLTVRELIEHLKTLPQDLPVLRAEDDEGNGYDTLDKNFISLMSYEAYDREIEIGIPELTDKKIKEGYCEDDVKPNLCVVIG